MLASQLCYIINQTPHLLLCMCVAYLCLCGPSIAQLGKAFTAASHFILYHDGLYPPSQNNARQLSVITRHHDGVTGLWLSHWFQYFSSNAKKVVIGNPSLKKHHNHITEPKNKGQWVLEKIPKGGNLPKYPNLYSASPVSCPYPPPLRHNE